jgi:hypothetical protein
MINLKLSNNVFPHLDHKYLSSCVMVYRDDVIVDAFPVPGYVRNDAETFQHAMNVADIARGLKKTLNVLGHEVSLAKDLKSSIKCSDVIREDYKQIV